MLEILKYIAAIIGTYYFACLLQAVLHARLGHERAGGQIFQTHLRNHHAIYSDFFASKEYIDEEQSLTAFYLIPIIGCSAIAFWIFSFALALTILATFIISLWLHAFIHVQYHLEDTVWSRYSWFRKRQSLHQVHHEFPNRNFGVLEFVWDRVLGTYMDPAAAGQGGAR